MDCTEGRRKRGRGCITVAETRRGALGLFTCDRMGTRIQCRRGEGVTRRSGAGRARGARGVCREVGYHESEVGSGRIGSGRVGSGRRGIVRACGSAAERASARARP